MRVRKRLWLGVGLAAIAAVTAVAAAATGGSGVSGSDKITTIAGTGKQGFSGDGGPATKATLSLPRGVDVDAKGNVYIAIVDERVRKVSPAGKITTVAGTVNKEEPLWEPREVAAGTNGNVYFLAGVAQTDVVYRVSPGGKRTIFAGGGTATYPGYGDGGPATAASTGALSGLAVDSKGNVYFGDGGISGSGPHVRKVTPEGIISTVAGTARGAIDAVDGMAVDRQGNLYIADGSPYSRVYKVTPSGKTTTFAGAGRAGFSGDGGPATKAMLYQPRDVAVDEKGNVYIADPGNNRVRKVSRGGKITTFAGSGGYRFPPNPPFSGDGGPANKAHLFRPLGVAMDAQGNVYIADAGNQRVRKVTAGTATAPAKKKAPRTKARKKAPQAGSTQAVKAAASRLEGDLAQLASGRAKLKNALSGVVGCSLSPQAATVQLTAVIANRQRILTQLHALGSPTAQVARLRSLLGDALAHSIAADRHYRDWLGYLQGQPRCSTARNRDYAAAQREDRLASAAKQRFVAAFNPLARQLHLRTWSAAEF